MGLVLGPGFDPAPLPRNRGLTDETPELGESSVPSSEQDLDQRQGECSYVMISCVILGVYNAVFVSH